MNKKVGSAYVEGRILSASPLELVVLAYQTAIGAVRDAREHLAQKRIAERVRAISLAHGVLAELYRSLDFRAGDGSLSRELGRLYDYMMRRLLQANAHPDDAPLAEVLTLLRSLSESWETLAAKPTALPPQMPAASMNPAWFAGDMAAGAPASRYSLSF